MHTKLTIFALSVFLIMNLCGCLFVTAQIAKNAATISQDLETPYIKLVDAVEATFKDLGFTFKKAEILPEIATIKGVYTNDKTTHITITKISEERSHMQLRVGMSKEDSQVIFAAIQQHIK